MKQNNQSSWAARLRKISALCLALVASGNVWAAEGDKVTAIVKPGETQQIVIALQNTEDAPYTAFQMDIVLPEGIEFAEGDDVVTLYRGHSSHQVEKNISGSTMKIVAYSYDGTDGNKPFDGTSGNLLIVKVKSTNEFTTKDDYVIKDFVQNQIFVGTNLSGENSISGDEHPIIPIKLGDVNGDNDIDALDASLIQKNVARIIADDAEGYIIDVADTNGDASVDALDASLVQKIAAKKIKGYSQE